MPKLNERASAIAKEIIGKRTAEGEARLGMEKLEVLKEEYKARLKGLADEMRNLAKEREVAIAKLREETKEKAIAADEYHDQFIAKMREAQPELQEIEFSLDLKEMTWKEEGTRENDSIDIEILPTVEDAFKKLMARL